MGRLIDMQAAIDAVEAEPINGWIKQHLVEELMTLPPAQPEIVYCKDCQYYVYGLNEEDYYCRRTGIGQPDDFFCACGKERDGTI